MNAHRDRAPLGCLVAIGLLAGWPDSAKAQEVTSAPDISTELTPVLTRWSRIPAFQARIRWRIWAGAAPDSLGERVWDESAWTPPSQAKAEEITARFRGNDYELRFRAADGQVGQEHRWNSFVGREFIHLDGPLSTSPLATIGAPWLNDQLGAGTLLTALEQQYFSFFEPWSTVLPDLGCALEITEDMEGQTCWRIRNTARTDEYRLTAWVAPDKDFAPVRMSFTWVPPNSQAHEWQIRVTAHLPVGESWIAARAISGSRFQQNDQNYWQMSTIEVSDIQIGDEFAPVSLRAQLPPGTQVEDLVGRQSWHVGADGQITNVQTPETDRMLRMVVPLTPAEIAAQKALGRRCAIISAVLLGAMTFGVAVMMWRRWFRLLLTAACALVAVAWGVSIPYCITYEPGPDYFPGPTVLRTPGGFRIPAVRMFGIGWGEMCAHRNQWNNFRSVGLHIGRRLSGPTRWWPHGLDRWRTTLPFLQVGVPLWIPLVALAVPTALVWRRWFRRARPGHCPRCGYNLTGNVSGVCPECGTPWRNAGINSGKPEVLKDSERRTGSWQKE